MFVKIIKLTLLPKNKKNVNFFLRLDTTNTKTN